MPFEVQLDYDRGVPVYRQIHEAVVHALASGRLAADEQLPTIAELASRLGVNPNTVARAYRDLEQAGHIVGKRGRGTFPAPGRRAPAGPDREAILRDIYQRAIADGAAHAISARDIIRYFRKALQDE
ncbi:MAG: GntR family transcriptional regulator [Deltaproteobacteria bacterium]|nr:GntR family transcriptional regulator [Nannocystaceae bacterium]